MLVLSRKIGQTIIVETEKGPIEIVVTRIEGGSVRLGIEADKSIQIQRGEVMNGNCN